MQTTRLYTLERTWIPKLIDSKSRFFRYSSIYLKTSMFVLKSDKSLQHAESCEDNEGIGKVRKIARKSTIRLDGIKQRIRKLIVYPH